MFDACSSCRSADFFGGASVRGRARGAVTPVDSDVPRVRTPINEVDVGDVELALFNEDGSVGLYGNRVESVDALDVVEGDVAVTIHRNDVGFVLFVRAVEVVEHEGVGSAAEVHRDRHRLIGVQPNNIVCIATGNADCAGGCCCPNVEVASFDSVAQTVVGTDVDGGAS